MTKFGYYTTTVSYDVDVYYIFNFQFNRQVMNEENYNSVNDIHENTWIYLEWDVLNEHK